MPHHIQMTAITLQPFAAWEKVEKGWLCVRSASADFLQQRLSNEEFDRRYPVLKRP